MARKRRIIADNPVAFVERPRADEYDPDRLNFDDARAYLNAAEGDEFEAFFYVALATGMRLGEVLGLRWSNVDLERRTIAVRTSLGLGLDGKTRLGPTKTHRSSRNVYFHQGVAESLKRRKVAQAKARLLAGAEWAQTVRHLDDLVPNDLVFTNSMGEPLSRTNFTRTHHGRILKKAGLRRITFHELRHSFISLHNDLRTDVASVAQTVGHKDSTLTMRVYTHATEDVQRSAAASLEIALGLCSSESTSELREAFDQHSSV
jgi:integrase